jgi:cation/acetate symporter
VTFLVSLTFAVAASTNLPLLLFTIYWRHFNTAGAFTGVITGFISSLLLAVLGSSLYFQEPLIPLANPGIVSIPLGFLGAVIGTFLSKSPDEGHFDAVLLKSQTGLVVSAGSKTNEKAQNEQASEKRGISWNS